MEPLIRRNFLKFVGSLPFGRLLGIGKQKENTHYDSLSVSFFMTYQSSWLETALVGELVYKTDYGVMFPESVLNYFLDKDIELVGEVVKQYIDYKNDKVTMVKIWLN